MASRCIRLRLRLRNIRRYSSVSAAATETSKPDIFTQIPLPKPDPIVNLDDSKQLFSSISTPKLVKSALTLEMAAMEPVVDFGMWVMNNQTVMNNPLLRRIVLGFTERTFFDHFCGGQDLSGAGRAVQQLSDAGLRSMLDYGLEHSTDNRSCDRNLDEFNKTFDWTKSINDDTVSFIVVKITAICPSNLLHRVSDLLRWQYRDKSLHLPWKLKTLPIFTESSPLFQTVTRPAPLTVEEERDLDLAYARLDRICRNSLESGIPMVIDAEDTSVQPAIDYFTYSAAIKHTKGEDKPIIFNTIQAYLKDAKERLVAAKLAADRLGVPVGFKLVRGAYMSRENEVARSLGFRSPIHDSINDTHDCYNGCTEFLLEEMANGPGSVVLATHNAESGKLAARRAWELGIKTDSPNLQFAQLYGMAEALSYGLKNAGFRVSKYIPFGPIDQIMPYLLRRAEENRGLLSTSSVDRRLIREEVVRRLLNVVN